MNSLGDNTTNVAMTVLTEQASQRPNDSNVKLWLRLPSSQLPNVRPSLALRSHLGVLQVRVSKVDQLPVDGKVGHAALERHVGHRGRVAQFPAVDGHQVAHVVDDAAELQRLVQVEHLVVAGLGQEALEDRAVVDEDDGLAGAPADRQVVPVAVVDAGAAVLGFEEPGLVAIVDDEDRSSVSELQ